MATGADGGYGEGGCSVDDPRDRRGSRTPDRLSEPTRTHHVCCTSCTYMPRLCLNCLPTRTHHACPVIPSRVLLRLVTLFINAMIWVSQFFKSPPEPINHHVSPVFPPLSYSLAFGHSDSKWGSESLSLMPWFELHNLSIVVRSFTTMIFTLYLTFVSFHHPLTAETKGGYEYVQVWRYGNMAIFQKDLKILDIFWKYLNTTANLPTKY